MVPTCLHIFEQRYSVIFNLTAQFSGKAAVSKVAKTAMWTSRPWKQAVSHRTRILELGTSQEDLQRQVMSILPGVLYLLLRWSLKTESFRKEGQPVLASPPHYGEIQGPVWIQSRSTATAIRSLHSRVSGHDASGKAAAMDQTPSPFPWLNQGACHRL